MQPGVAVIVTTYNHARFLADALDSVLAQTEPAREIVVVDDGSQDDPAAVVARYAGVRLIRQPNQGLAAARNTGLRAVGSAKVLFLDADDRLLPRAVAAGLACFERCPDAAFVYGGHRVIDGGGRPLSPDRYEAIGADPYEALLRGNRICMHAAALYLTPVLRAAGGFDTTLPRCEDYDLYLRISQRHAVASHAETVAEYRWHGSNMSDNEAEMLHWALHVHDRHAERAGQQAQTMSAWREGRRLWREHYAGEMLDKARRTARTPIDHARAVGRALIAAPSLTAQRVTGAVQRRLARALPLPASRGGVPAPGRVALGDLDRDTPISANFGYDRGTPIDRGYIEAFLQQHAVDIRGRALEIGDDAYCRRFGGARITRQDVLNIKATAPGTTIVGDLASAGVLPPAAFDCMVLTQTLHLIFDLRAAVARLHEALRPGGVALVTVPGITPIDRHEWRDCWYWSLTPQSAMRLFAEVFGAEQVGVHSWGNVLAATAFLHGLALEEVDRARLSTVDAAYPVTVAVRAVKKG